jgi:hypothetical protein
VVPVSLRPAMSHAEGKGWDREIFSYSLSSCSLVPGILTQTLSTQNVTNMTETTNKNKNNDGPKM